MTTSRRLLVTGSYCGLVRSVFLDERPESKNAASGDGSAESVRASDRALTIAKEVKINEQPTWVEKHPFLKDVFYTFGAINPGKDKVCPPGKLYMIKLDLVTGDMDIQSRAVSGGLDPCHIAISRDGSAMFVPHYLSGEIVVLPLSPTTGHFTASAPKPSQILAFTENTRIHQRQHVAHPHQIAPIYAGNQAYPSEFLVPDLGADVVWRVELDEEQGWKVKDKIGGFEGGSGPRHSVVHPDGKHLYTLNELAASLSVHTLPPLSSTSPAQILTTLTLLPPNYPEDSGRAGAELVLLPPAPGESRQLLIATNRASTDERGDTLALFSVSTTDGADLRRADEGWLYGCGSVLRGMGADDEGQLLGVVAQKTGRLSVFKVNGENLEKVAVLDDLRVGTDVAWM